MNGEKCQKVCQKSVSVEVGQWMETPGFEEDESVIFSPWPLPSNFHRLQGPKAGAP